MASTHILAVGKMTQGHADLRVAPLPPKQDSLMLAALDFGRRLYAAGASRAACLNAYEEAGWLEAEWEANTAAMPDGSLQQMIDYAAELQELEDDIADREFWASGNW